MNLAYRWFCLLGLDGEVPDHSTFSKNRHGRFRGSDVFRHMLETVVARAIKEGLVSGDGFAVDASLIAADANKQRSVAGSEKTDWLALAATRRSVREYLETLDEASWGAATEVIAASVIQLDLRATSSTKSVNGGHRTLKRKSCIVFRIISTELDERHPAARIYRLGDVISGMWKPTSQLSFVISIDRSL